MNSLQQAATEADAKLFELEDQQAAAEQATAILSAQVETARIFETVTLPAQQAQDRASANQTYFTLQSQLLAQIKTTQDLTAAVGNAQVASDAAHAATRQNPGAVEQNLNKL